MSIYYWLQEFREICDRCDEECITIDELSKLDTFTFIKMDIEGAEAKDLKGGEKFLRNTAVKAFICSYHMEKERFVNLLKGLSEQERQSNLKRARRGYEEKSVNADLL